MPQLLAQSLPGATLVIFDWWTLPGSLQFQLLPISCLNPPTCFSGPRWSSTRPNKGKSWVTEKLDLRALMLWTFEAVTINRIYVVLTTCGFSCLIFSLCDALPGQEVCWMHPPSIAFPSFLATLTSLPLRKSSVNVLFPYPNCRTSVWHQPRTRTLLSLGGHVTRM